MNIPKLLPIFLFVILCPQLSSSMGADGMEYEPIVVGDDSYTITCDWLVTSPFDEIGNGLRSDFFIHDGVLYFNYMADDNIYMLDRVDGMDGRHMGRVEIEWGSVPYYQASATYVGRDSEGTPFVASTGISDLDTGYPYTITVLDLSDTNPRAIKQYRFVNPKPWITGESAVYGSLNDGKFRVVTEISVPDEKIGRSRWGYAEWKVDGTPGRYSTSAAMTLSKSVAMPVDGDNVIIYDCDDALDGGAVQCAIPTLCRLGRGSFEVMDTFEGPMHDSNGTGLDIVCFDNAYFMIYGSGYNPAHYCVVLLDDYPRSLHCAKLWELGGEKPYTGQMESKSDLFSHNYKAMAVHSAIVSEDSFAFYVYTGQKGIAKYTVSCIKGESGLSEPSSGNTVRYYSISGVVLKDKPSAPGLYLRCDGCRIDKITIR